MKFISSFIFCILLFFPIQAKKKIVCIGASITAGAGTTFPGENSYPAQLAKLADKDYEVVNYGIGGTTMLRNGNHPYFNTEAYRQALMSNPDIVFIDLGGNDAKAVNRPFYNELESDTRDMIRSFKKLPSKPRVILLLPTAFFEKDSMQIWDPVSVNMIKPRLRKAAFDEKIEVIDMYPLLIDRPELVPDGIHPADKGSEIIAKRLYEQIQLNFDTGFDIFKSLHIPYTNTEFNGYECAGFKIDGRECKIVKPKTATTGRPWIWRARFWAHEPQTDIALLERGFHLVFCDASELMGNNAAISLWASFYSILVEAGLSEKPVMEGMSRGAMYVFCWTAANPDKVSAVYVDNPLLDCRYLADRDMGDMVTNFMAAYGIKTKEDIQNFNGSPTDKVKDIVEGDYPILILCADEDEAVPISQIYEFEKKIRNAGGDITVIVKHGFKHHPHSFPNPDRIIEFILNAVNKMGIQ